MKRKHLIILGVLCMYIFPALAQDTIYYDAKWRVTVVDNASYFRVKIKRGTGWQVRDCYLSGKSQMEGSYSDDSCKISQGLFSYYDENGVLRHTCNYVNGQLEGTDLLFYDSKQKRTEGPYKKGKRDGEWLGYYPSGKLSARAFYKKGDQISGSFYKEDGSRNESVNEFYRENSFPGGSPALQRFLIRNLKYPDSAVTHSIQGTVYVDFNISKDGQVQDIKVVRAVEPSLDKEALRVVGLMPEWEPLIIGGILCDSHHTQPIIFVLHD